MNIQEQSNHMVDVVTSVTYLPDKMIAIILPCVFALFAPKEIVDLFLQSKNVPDILNPWTGVVLLFVISFFVVHFFRKILASIKSRLTKTNDDEFENAYIGNK